MLAAAATAMIAGCAATRVSEGPPQAVSALAARPLDGAVDYDGNPAYLPQMLSRRPVDAAPALRVSFRYAYEVSYDTPREHELTIINPLLIFGVPKSSDTLHVRGSLEVLVEGRVVRQYVKAVMLGKDRTLFSEGQTLSDIRRSGLLLVRDHIDAMLQADRAFIEGLSAGRATPPSSLVPRSSPVQGEGGGINLPSTEVRP